MYETVGYTPAHLERSNLHHGSSQVQLTGSGVFQASPSRSRSRLSATPGRLQTPMVSTYKYRRQIDELCIIDINVAQTTSATR